jgi:hypothetical protein
MSQAYRTSHDEERYQSALAAFLERATSAKQLLWIYSRRKARHRAGLFASLLLFVAYPAAFCALLLSFISANTIPLAASLWLTPGALLLSIAPLVLYRSLYWMSLRQRSDEIDHIFVVPPRLESIDESIQQLNRLEPLQDLRKHCAGLAPTSVRWSFGASSAFTTQLLCLLLLGTLSSLSHLHPAPTSGSWQDALASTMFMSGLLFVGFYPMLLSRWLTMSDTEEKAGISPLALYQPPMGDEVRPATAFAIMLGVISLFSEGLHRGDLRPLHLVACTTGPILFAFILHSIEEKSIQRLSKRFLQEHNALYS